jgi:hypothetical protein
MRIVSMSSLILAVVSCCRATQNWTSAHQSLLDRKTLSLMRDHLPGKLHTLFSSKTDTSFREIQIFVKDSINNSNHVANKGDSTADSGVDLKMIIQQVGAAFLSMVFVSEVFGQQQEILQSVAALRKAVENGMRTLSARVHTVEETLQDLIDAVDEQK